MNLVAADVSPRILRLKAVQRRLTSAATVQGPNARTFVSGHSRLGERVRVRANQTS